MTETTSPTIYEVDAFLFDVEDRIAKHRREEAQGVDLIIALGARYGMLCDALLQQRDDHSKSLPDEHLQADAVSIYQLALDVAAIAARIAMEETSEFSAHEIRK